MGKNIPSVLALLGVLTATGIPAHSEVRLPVSLVPQKSPNLCWAASTEIVMNYTQPSLNIQQCALVDSVTNRLFNCCLGPPEGTPDWMLGGCDKKQDDLPITKFKNQDGNQYQVNKSTGKVPWVTAIAELDNNRPFVFSFAYLTGPGGHRTGNGHALVAYGYNKTWVNPETNLPDSALIVWDPYGPRNQKAVGDAYYLSYAAYDYGLDRFEHKWYADGPSWSNIR